MIDKNAPYRPGLAAIAAVLALSSTPVIAQVTLPADPAPAAASAAPVAAPAAPVQAAPVQTVQAVPVTPQLPEIAVPETTHAAPRAQAPAHNAVTRTAQRATPVRAAAAEPRVAASTPAVDRVTPAAPPADVAPAKPKVAHVTPLVATPSRDARPAPAAPAASAQNSAEDNYAGWALLGGGLLLVGSGAAFALSRRPKRRDEIDYVAANESMTTLSPAPVVAAEPVVAQPVVRQPAHDPVPARAAAFAPRMAEPVTLDRDYADMEPQDRRAVLEAMVAQEPTEANPFHSRRNRLRRADFLLRTGRVEPRQGEYAVTEERELETAGARDRWSEMRLKGSQKTRISWRPARS